MRKVLLSLWLCLMAGPNALASEPLHIGWLGMNPAQTAERSFVDGAAPNDEGLAGLRLAIADNNAGGKFMDQSYVLDAVTLPANGDWAAALTKLAAQKVRLVVVDLPADILLQAAAHPAAREMLVINAAREDDALRNKDCRRTILHTIPSRAMRSDALAQFLIRKNWRKWLLISGTNANDQAFAQALRHSATKFGAKLVGDKTWTYTSDARRTAQGEASSITQSDAYDVVVVADETNQFGDILPFDTWLPRPVAGTHGLGAWAWHPAFDQWGATQLQNRFHAQTGRTMTDRDFAAWEGGRAMAEAAMRLRSTDPARIADFMHTDQFTLAAFKGRSLSFRAWDGQLRQPMLVAWSRAVVSVAPEEGFLHPITDLDTLGTDKGESQCVLH